MTGALRFAVLGPVRGWWLDEPLDLGPARRRAVLALLLAHAGEMVAMDRVVAMLWESGMPGHPANIVHKHIGALRRLEDPDLPRRSQGGWLLSTAGGYRVERDSARIDVCQFRALAAAVADVADPQERLRGRLEALELWSGPPACDVAVTFRRDPVFAALSHEYRTMVIEAADCALVTGQVPRVISRLRLGTEICPTDELVHVQLMRCLAQDGQRVDALDVYAELRSRLLEERGVEPGHAVRRVLDHVHDQASFNRRLPLG